MRDLQSNPKQAAAFAAENDPFHDMSDYLIGTLVENQKADAFPALVAAIREKDPESPFITEAAINRLGYFLLQGQKMREALLVFEVNTREYPKSANAFDSLGEAQFKNGQQQTQSPVIAVRLRLTQTTSMQTLRRSSWKSTARSSSSRTLKKKRYRAAS